MNRKIIFVVVAIMVAVGLWAGGMAYSQKLQAALWKVSGGEAACDLVQFDGHQWYVWTYDGAYSGGIYVIEKK